VGLNYLHKYSFKTEHSLHEVIERSMPCIDRQHV